MTCCLVTRALGRFPTFHGHAPLLPGSPLRRIWRAFEVPVARISTAGDTPLSVPRHASTAHFAEDTRGGGRDAAGRQAEHRRAAAHRALPELRPGHQRRGRRRLLPAGAGARTVPAAGGRPQVSRDGDHGHAISSSPAPFCSAGTQ